MTIPSTVKVGGYTYDVSIIDHAICINQKECYGDIDYDFHKIRIRNDIQSPQGMGQTFLHELVHAMTRERGISWGENDELFTDELAKCLYQVIQDNPLIFSVIKGAGKK